MPTICQLVHGLPVGGAEVLVDRFVRQLGGEFRFVIACLDQIGLLGEGLERDGFQVVYLGRQPGIDLGCQRRLAKLLREERIDVVHAHQYTPFAYALLARALRAHPPIVLTEHGRFFPDYPRRKRMIFNRLAISKRDRFIGVGSAVAKALVENEGLPAARVDVIYNGIDLSPYDDLHDRQAVRSDLDLAESDFAILQVARLDHLKDHITAIRTIHRVVQDRPNAKLLIVGDGPERPAIEAEIERLGVAQHVRVLGLRRDVPRLLQAADAFLLTSISEGIPLTLIEAMAAAVPIVSTAVGGVPEVLGDPSVGLVAPPGDAAALAAAMIRLLDDASLRRAFSQQGRRRATELFCERQMHDKYREVYAALLSKQDSRLTQRKVAEQSPGQQALVRSS